MGRTSTRRRRTLSSANCSSRRFWPRRPRMSVASCSSCSICLRTRWISLDTSPNLCVIQTNRQANSKVTAQEKGKRQASDRRFGTYGVGEVITAPGPAARGGGGGRLGLRGDGADAWELSSSAAVAAAGERREVRDAAEAAAVQEMRRRRRRGLHAGRIRPAPRLW